MSTLPEEITIDLPGGVPMAFRLIVDVDEGKTAEFWMGSRGMGNVESWFNNEEPRHRVVIEQPYYLGVTPVTQAQYRAIASLCREELEKLSGNKGVEPSHFKGDERPVEQVDWRDAEVVCRWLSGYDEFRGKVPPRWIAGLPNEAQWEYACRAGTNTEYHTGDGEAALREAGWFGEKWDEGGTHPVASPEKKRNDFGLADMHGNVWEWCRDIFDPLAYAKRESGWVERAWMEGDAGRDAENKYSDDGSFPRVLRGGSWDYSASFCRSAVRFRDWAGYRSRLRGFRVCLFPGPADSQPDP